MVVVVLLVGVVLHRLLLSLGLRRTALPAVMAACLGSDLWTVASQAPWQHGPAALFLVLTIALLQRQPLSRLRLALAGVACTFLFACRQMDALFVAAVVAWLAWTNWRGLFWFLPAPILGGLALLGYNLWLFGAVLGGQAVLERFHTFRHGVAGPWSGSPRGAARNLAQPESRTAGLQPLDRGGAREPVRAGRGPANRLGLFASMAARSSGALRIGALEVLRLRIPSRSGATGPMLFRSSPSSLPSGLTGCWPDRAAWWRSRRRP